MLPEIEVEVTEMSEAQFNRTRGMAGRSGGRLDTDLFKDPASAKKSKKKKVTIHFSSYCLNLFE